ASRCQAQVATDSSPKCPPEVALRPFKDNIDACGLLKIPISDWPVPPTRLDATEAVSARQHVDDRSILPSWASQVSWYRSSSSLHSFAVPQNGDHAEAIACCKVLQNP